MKILIQIEKDNGEVLWEGKFASVDIMADNLYAYMRHSPTYKAEIKREQKEINKLF